MLIFNEGNPRAGKSYDAVLTHILPSIKKGRKVFARLDGLKYDKIAAYLDMDESEVRSLLIHVSVEDMPKIAEIVEPDCLAVIDECHKYYVQSLKSLPPKVEDFFAEHGKAGMDILLISQYYKRLHSAIRGRVERKNVFQKLTAVGMKDSYLVTYYHSTAPDKYEKVGSAKKKYLPVIWGLYDGYLPGTENREVYEEGGITIWKTILPWFILAGVLLLAGGFFYVRFFMSSGGSKPIPKPAVSQTAAAVKALPVSVPVPGQTAKPVKPKRPDMPPEAAYVWSLNDQARARLAGYVSWPDGRFDGIVEWRADSSRVVDSLTIEQIRSLGVTVVRRKYGVSLTWGAGKDLQTIIVTSWPLDQPQRYSQQDVADIQKAGPVLQDTVPGVGSQGDAVAPVPMRRQRATARAYTPPESLPWNSDPFGAGGSR